MASTPPSCRPRASTRRRGGAGRAALLALVVDLLVTARPSSAQTVADALLQIYNGNAAAIARGAAGLGQSLAPAESTPGAQLPTCGTTNVLLASGGWPRDWAKLSPQQQASHPITPVMMQLAYEVYQPAGEAKACLAGMGVDTSSLTDVTRQLQAFGTSRTAYVLRAGNERIFVLFRGSGGTDVPINIACRHVTPAGGAQAYGAKASAGLALHRGFAQAWEALERGVVDAINAQLKQVPSREVYVVGHSLGAAVAAIAALRLETLLPGGVSGVWLFAAPRAGNSAWAQAYNAALLSKTMRFVNYQDFAVRVPDVSQSCSIGGASLSANTARFEFAHVGRSVLMCPDPRSGLTDFRVNAGPSEALDCVSAADVDATGITHLLGSYFDAWRRGYAKATGNNLASSPFVKSVLCQACAVQSTPQTRLEQVAAPARPGGPVTCGVSSSCSIQRAFDAATAVGNTVSAAWVGSGSTCRAFMCSKSS